ncbi:hypothetical protein [Solicola sp. PLA-1-18]|uniref:hypothetical protein n=1 Tax=Solicola sp. PLA-1-18 TaxID=3380532 RepID=UPI003B7F16F3
MTKTTGPGRPSKGERDAFFTRPARPVGDAVRAQADAMGLNLGDYIAKVLAEHHDLGHLAPVGTRNSDQRELPLQQSA